MEHGPTTTKRRGSLRSRIARTAWRPASTVRAADSVKGRRFCTSSGERISSMLTTLRLSSCGASGAMFIRITSKLCYLLAWSSSPDGNLSDGLHELIVSRTQPSAHRSHDLARKLGRFADEQVEFALAHRKELAAGSGSDGGAAHGWVDE